MVFIPPHVESRPHKSVHDLITPRMLQERVAWCKRLGYNKPKWVYFCDQLIRLGLTVYLYEARQTRSKYITVQRGDKKFKVRFSDHKPIAHREQRGDCDFFVGITNKTRHTTEDAIRATLEYFNGQD